MTGAYVFIMALGFWMLRISFGGLTGAVLYVGYSALLGFLVFVLTGKGVSLGTKGPGYANRSTLTGSIGYLASYAFLQRIYGSIKVD